MSYWDCGEYRLRHGVLELIAGISLLGIKGVRGLGTRSLPKEERFRRKDLTKGVKAKIDRGTITLELQVYADYGTDFRQSALLAQRAVKETVEKMTGLPVNSVDVEIVGVSAP